MTYKLGSTGDDVKKIQNVVGCAPDGSFGPTTEKKVKEWQSTHGLTADGVVGPSTWAKMFGAVVSDSKCVDASVKYNPLKVHISQSTNRPIKYLAIHFTAGGRSTAGTANNVKKVFETRKASADFCVDDKEMVQFNPDLKNYYCWAVGDKRSLASRGGQLYGIATNRNTISIEICSTLKSGTTAAVPNHDGWTFTDAALENAVKLSKILMKKYNIPLDHVVRHYDISGKLCPGIVGWNNGPLYSNIGKTLNTYNDSKKWEMFKSRLK